MTVLRINNVYSWLLTQDTDLKDRLCNSMRFRDKGARYTKAYQQGKWDGFKEFFKRKSGRFLTGLLPEVELTLKTLNKSYEIVDERKGNISWTHKNLDENFLLPWLPEGVDSFTLHDYQPDFVNKIMKSKRCLLKAPTSAGKTFIMVSLLKCLPPKTPTLFMTKNVSLVDQNYHEMKEWGIENVGRWYGDHKSPDFITCANANVHTLNSIKKLLPKFKVLIVDEIHECMSDVPVNAYMQMVNAGIRVGISATPFKDKKVHKFSVKGHFGPIVKTSTTDSGFLTTKELQERGILSKSKCTFYKINEPSIPYEPYIDAVSLGISENFAFHKKVRDLARSLKGRTLILVERRNQGEYLKQLIPEAAWVNGDDSVEDRKPVMEALRSDENAIAIVMRQIITAGINVKVHNLINASGGMAAHNVIQQMGRGLRVANDKDVLNFYDFIFDINKYLYNHSKARIRTLTEEGHDVVVKDDF